jgi:quercetin dioxygenase-like cupin family protein
MQTQLRTKRETDATAQIENWGTLTWLASRPLTGSALTFGRVVIRPGRSNPRHAHDNCEEVLYLLSGRLRHSFGDKTVEMEAGDTLVVPAGVLHNAVNTGDTDADMIVAYSSGDRGFRPEDRCP